MFLVNYHQRRRRSRTQLLVMEVTQMDNDDRPVGRVLSRREVLALFGTAGAAMLIGRASEALGAAQPWSAQATPTPESKVYLPLVRKSTAMPPTAPTVTPTASATATPTATPTSA